MSRRLPPLNALRAFEAAGRHVSFSGAAEELHVTHAAISRHVRGLEKRMGVQLFQNVARGVELTEAGTKFLQAVSPALDQIAAATAELSDETEARISVSCEPTFAVKWLMPRLGTFQDAYPEVEVKFEASPRLVNIQQYECDLAVRFCAGDTPGLASDMICRSPVYPVGAPKLRGGKARPRTPADLLSYRLMHEDKGQLWQRWFTNAGIAETDVKRLRSPGGLSSLLAIEGALAGQGLALISEELAFDDMESGRLERYSELGLSYGGYYLVYLKETVRRRPVQAFRKWLLETTEPLRSKS